MAASSWRMASGGCLILALLLAAGMLSAGREIPAVAFTFDAARADNVGNLPDEISRVDSSNVGGMAGDPGLEDYSSFGPNSRHHPKPPH
ncbi:hypothetical protein ACP70R_008324 [Stipagrostis hirtigluma subsp. patula]